MRLNLKLMNGNKIRFGYGFGGGSTTPPTNPPTVPNNMIVNGANNIVNKGVIVVNTPKTP